MRIRKFNENYTDNFNMKFIDATFLTSVEHGEVNVEIDGVELTLHIEEDGNDFNVYMNLMDFEELDIDIETEKPVDYEVSGEIRIIDKDFVDDVYDFYRKTGEHDGHYSAQYESKNTKNLISKKSLEKLIQRIDDKKLNDNDFQILKQMTNWFKNNFETLSLGSK